MNGAVAKERIKVAAKKSAKLGQGLVHDKGEILRFGPEDRGSSLNNQDGGAGAVRKICWQAHAFPGLKGCSFADESLVVGLVRLIMQGADGGIDAGNGLRNRDVVLAVPRLIELELLVKVVLFEIR